MSLQELEVFLGTLPYSAQLVLYVAMLTVSIFILWDHFFLSKTHVIRSFLQEDWKYLGAAWGITQVVNLVAVNYSRNTTFTDIIYNLEGQAVAVFQKAAFEPLTWILSVVYFVLFPVLILSTYFKVKEHHPIQAERYTIAYALTTTLSLPLFILFPVEVTGHTIPGVEPRLYTLHPVITQGFQAFDSFAKAFPSLHAGLSILAAIYSWKTTRTYALLATFSAIIIVFSTFYLGIHWILDAIAGLLLVFITYTISEHIPLHQNIFHEHTSSPEKEPTT